jgi:hypothetical protein
MRNVRAATSGGTRQRDDDGCRPTHPHTCEITGGLGIPYEQEKLFKLSGRRRKRELWSTGHGVEGVGQVAESFVTQTKHQRRLDGFIMALQIYKFRQSKYSLARTITNRKLPFIAHFFTKHYQLLWMYSGFLRPVLPEWVSVVRRTLKFTLNFYHPMSPES